jgi:diaminopimelate epimerase
MPAPPVLQIASASGNVFGYLWKAEMPANFDGPRWAQILCPRGRGLGLDGIFLVEEPSQERPWRMEHWDADGSETFCSNGTRAALALRGAPGSDLVQVESNRLPVLLRREEKAVGLRLPEDEECGFHPVEIGIQEPWAYGWIGNPQLVIEVAKVDEIDLPTYAPPLRSHPALPAGANVNVLEVLGPGQARIRSWERGVEGETLCCGTGCAVAGAWLARRSGVRRWSFLTAGTDPVAVEIGAIEGSRWKDLWLSGPVLRIGAVESDASLWSVG